MGSATKPAASSQGEEAFAGISGPERAVAVEGGDARVEVGDGGDEGSLSGVVRRVHEYWVFAAKLVTVVGAQRAAAVLFGSIDIERDGAGRPVEGIRCRTDGRAQLRGRWTIREH